MAKVQFFRDAAETNGRDLFECSLAQWHFFLELGRTFGWQSQGATYELRSDSKITAAARRDYEPGAPSDRKLVDVQDARNWARALEDALNSPHLPAMIESHAMVESPSEGAVKSVSDALAEFTQYAYGGAFAFARDDA